MLLEGNPSMDQGNKKEVEVGELLPDYQEGQEKQEGSDTMKQAAVGITTGRVKKSAGRMSIRKGEDQSASVLGKRGERKVGIGAETGADAEDTTEEHYKKQKGTLAEERLVDEGKEEA